MLSSLSLCDSLLSVCVSRLCDGLQRCLSSRLCDIDALLSYVSRSRLVIGDGLLAEMCASFCIRKINHQINNSQIRRSNHCVQIMITGFQQFDQTPCTNSISSHNDHDAMDPDTECSKKHM